MHRRFGSLFWLLGVLIGPLFHKKNWSLLGPYLEAWGSLLVLEAVRGPKGSKWTKMANLSAFDRLGPFWAHLDPFRPLDQTRIDILLRSTPAKSYFIHFRQKHLFCLVFETNVNTTDLICIQLGIDGEISW